MDISSISIDKPENMNFILGHSHFIKTIEDIDEAIANINQSIEYGAAFSEASGPCLIRKSGSRDDLRELAVKNLENLAAGHTFIIMLRNAFPINILGALKNVPEIVRIHCATANPTEVIVAKGVNGNGILGVVDGFAPKGVEDEVEIEKRRKFLKMIGYKY